jgi:hypothetical protein
MENVRPDRLTIQAFLKTATTRSFIGAPPEACSLYFYGQFVIRGLLVYFCLQLQSPNCSRTEKLYFPNPSMFVEWRDGSGTPAYPSSSSGER